MRLSRFIPLALALATACSRSPEQRVRDSAQSLLLADRTQSALETVESYLRDHPDAKKLAELRFVLLLKSAQLDAAFEALPETTDRLAWLERAMRQEDGTVRANALRLIAMNGCPVNCRALLRAAEDSEPAVRRYCAQALGARKECDTRLALYRLLQDDETRVKIEAARAFAQRQEPEAIGWLIGALGFGDEWVQAAIETAIVSLAEPANQDIIVHATRKPRKGAHLGLGLALMKLRSPMASDLLTVAAESGTPRQQYAALRALVDYPKPSVINLMVELSQSTNSVLRAEAQHSLEIIHTRRQMPGAP